MEELPINLVNVQFDYWTLVALNKFRRKQGR